MTPKEWIQKAIRREPTDILPYALGFGGELRERLVEFTGDPEFDKDVEPHVHSVRLGYPETHERVDDTHYTDAFGVIWTEAVRGELGVVLEPTIKEASLDGYEFPSTNHEGMFDTVPDQLAEHPDRFSTWGIGFSLFERAWSLRTIPNFLMDLVEHPAFAHELLDRICEFNLSLIEQACQYDIDCVRFGDDWGQQGGLIMGPHYWREFIKPPFARMVKKAASYGKATFLHSDGDLTEIVPDLIEIGLTILNPVQPDVMDIYGLKKEYGADITFWGGVSVQHLLPDSTPDQLRRELDRLMTEVGAGGGFVISPTHSMGSDIPLENLVVMLDAFTKQG